MIWFLTEKILNEVNRTDPNLKGIVSYLKDKVEMETYLNKRIWPHTGGASSSQQMLRIAANP